jgi:dihydrofolate reductase
MHERRRIIVYIATSADGYIARKDGGVEWLDRPRPPGNYGMAEFLRSIDTVLWGRKTYRTGSGRMFGAGLQHYVFSRGEPGEAEPGVAYIREPLREFVESWRGRPGKNAWMMGGAGLIASFLDEGLIDEFLIHVVPLFIGEGIPLIAPRDRNVPMTLEGLRRYSDGVVRLHYRIL